MVRQKVKMSKSLCLSPISNNQSVVIKIKINEIVKKV